MSLSDLLKQVTANRRERDKPKPRPKSKAQIKREEQAAKAQRSYEEELVYLRAAAQSRYHEKNKAKLNRIRALRARLPENVYQRAKRRAEARGQAWEFNFDTWFGVWEAAPRVYDPSTGFLKKAWACKGGNYTRDTQMLRRDTQGPWSVSNCFIGINGEEIKEHV